MKLSLRFLVFLISVAAIQGQEFKQFVFPGGDDSPLDDGAAVRGAVHSGADPRSGEASEEVEVRSVVNDPGRAIFPQSLSALPSVQYPPAGYVPQQPLTPPQPLQPNPSLPYPPQQPYVPQPPLQPLPPTGQPDPAGHAYEINYCDKAEFPSTLLAQYDMERIDYFIYNKTCSGIFFQCSIGKTFMLRCPSPKQAFDPAIVNCNFRSDNRICPEYDHIVHCTIQETCTENQYACCAEPQQCIDLSRRCDSHPDCSNGEDENNCPSCAKHEFACVKSGRCIPHEKRCDGVPDDCGDGSNLDESGCSKNSTCWGKFVCDSAQTIETLGHSECIDYALHCDGQRHCPGGEDELNCRQTSTNYLLCENQKQSVTKEQWCDGTENCSDGSDEKYCY